MLTLYLGLLIAGGVLLMVPLLGLGHHEPEGPDGHGGVPSEAWPWLPWASLRFWSFAAAFGGLAGTLLTWMGAGRAATGIAAGVVGWVSGAGVTAAISHLRGRSADGNYGEDDFAGASGRVLLPVGAAANPGRVRVRVAGRDVDRPAVTEDGRALVRGETVVVWRVQEDGTLLVTATEAAPTKM